MILFNTNLVRSVFRPIRNTSVHVRSIIVWIYFIIFGAVCCLSPSLSFFHNFFGVLFHHRHITMYLIKGTFSALDFNLFCCCHALGMHVCFLFVSSSRSNQCGCVCVAQLTFAKCSISLWHQIKWSQRTTHTNHFASMYFDLCVFISGLFMSWSVRHIYVPCFGCIDDHIVCWMQQPEGIVERNCCISRSKHFGNRYIHNLLMLPFEIRRCIFITTCKENAHDCVGNWQRKRPHLIGKCFD